MKQDVNKIDILKELIRHVESGKNESIFMEIQERDTHLLKAAREMPDSIVVVYSSGKIFLAEKERFLKESIHA